MLLFFPCCSNAEVHRMKIGMVVPSSPLLKITHITSLSEFRIEELFVYYSNVILGLQALNVIEYSDHYHSWIVEPSNIFTTVHVKDLQSRQILTLRPVRGFITLKCAVQ